VPSHGHDVTPRDQRDESRGAKIQSGIGMFRSLAADRVPECHRAEQEGRTNSDLIRDALRRYLQAS
jgi:hypothetical protein